MNAYGVILLATLILAVAAGAEALHATAPAWRSRCGGRIGCRIGWTTPPICTDVELNVGCVPLGDVAGEKDQPL